MGRGRVREGGGNGRRPSGWWWWKKKRRALYCGGGPSGRARQCAPGGRHGMAHPAAGIKRAADRGAGAGREARGRAAPPHPSHACEKNKARTPAGVCDTPHARRPGTAHRARPCVHVLDDRPETSPGRWRHQAVATKGRLGARSVGGRSAPRTPRAAAVPVAPIAFFVRLSLPRPRHSSGNSINSPRRCACSRMSPSAEVEAAAAAVSGVAAGVRERKAGLAAAERAGAGPLAGRARARGPMGAYTGMLLREGHTHTRARAGRSRRVTRRGCGGGGREKKGGGGRETCVRGASERLSSHSSISFFFRGPVIAVAATSAATPPALS